MAQEKEKLWKTKGIFSLKSYVYYIVSILIENEYTTHDFISSDWEAFNKQTKWCR